MICPDISMQLLHVRSRLSAGFKPGILLPACKAISLCRGACLHAGLLIGTNHISDPEECSISWPNSPNGLPNLMRFTWLSGTSRLAMP